MKKKKLINFITVSIILIIIILGVVISAYSNDFFNLNDEVEEELIFDVVVEIKGEVNQPGIYLVPNGTILSEVIVLAKGFTNKAYIQELDLDMKVVDGQVIFIKSSNKININTATLEELVKLPGIATTKANAIIDYRNEFGNFETIEDLKNVKGIGENTFLQIKDYITTSETE